jgi:hypothetical protein
LFNLIIYYYYDRFTISQAGGIPWIIDDLSGGEIQAVLSRRFFVLGDITENIALFLCDQLEAQAKDPSKAPAAYQDGALIRSGGANLVPGTFTKIQYPATVEFTALLWLFYPYSICYPGIC